jgi:hypothetical protein
MNMDLIVVILIAVLIGFLVYLLTTHVPMPPGWARAIQVLALIVLVLWVITKLITIPNVLPR